MELSGEEEEGVVKVDALNLPPLLLLIAAFDESWYVDIRVAGWNECGVWLMWM